MRSDSLIESLSHPPPPTHPPTHPHKQTESRSYSGQGAVKRYLIDLFVRDKDTTASFALDEVDVPYPGFAEVPVVVSSPEAGIETSLRLGFQFLADGGSGFVGGQQVMSLVASTTGVTPLKDSSHGGSGAEVASPGGNALAESISSSNSNSNSLSSSASTGPKWETDDGRVVQKIWQQAGCFDIGNTFLIEKMELTTGRLIVIVDQNVWDLYAPKIQTWCDHNDLELEAVVRPGNEDQKTMEVRQSFTYSLRFRFPWLSSSIEFFLSFSFCRPTPYTTHTPQPPSPLTFHAVSFYLFIYLFIYLSIDRSLRTAWRCWTTSSASTPCGGRSRCWPSGGAC
jgi:hypothetical protein